VLENRDRLMDCPQRGDELLAAGDGPERGVSFYLRCVEGGKVSRLGTGSSSIGSSR